jgi:undecaprenyl-diphosphatase
MDFLINLDHALFESINGVWTNSIFNWLMPAITDLHKSPVFFIILVPLLGFWIWRQRAYALKCLLALIIAAGCADLASYRIVKALVQRDRPVEAGMHVELRTPHHSGTSFPSNHTANMFAAAGIMTFALPAGAPVWFLVAGLVGYSRIYVGVHFPLDVGAGALLGLLMAALVWALLRKWILKSEEPCPRKS